MVFAPLGVRKASDGGEKTGSEAWSMRAWIACASPAKIIDSLLAGSMPLRVKAQVALVDSTIVA